MTRTWSESDRFVPTRIVRPLQAFLSAEAAGGILMLVAAVIALVWANSPWQESYRDLWATHLDIELGDLIHLELTLGEWVNDALMVLFFFVVGLEIKRELITGELRDPRAAALPVVAAVGGMVVPASIFLLFNAGGPGADGWGIPMATDIAFAVGVISLVGNRIPVGVKLFLLALAIVDDLGAILVIAIFYTDDLSFVWLAAAIAAVIVAYVMREAEVRSLVPYVALGVFAWLALHESGVHATLAGVAFGFITPVYPFLDPGRFRAEADGLIEEIGRGFAAGPVGHHAETAEARLHDLARLTAETEAPLDRLEHRLLPWTSFVIVPIFALANAGVELTGDDLSGALSDDVVLGVGLGLLLGKGIGIFAATWLAVKSGLGRLPNHAHWRDMAGVALLGGIGFTVALFVTNLAFTDPDLTDMAKVGILGGSLLSGLIGFAFLRSSPLLPDFVTEDPDEATGADGPPGKSVQPS